MRHARHARLNGLWKYMPHTATLAMVAAAAMAGVPLLNGFLSRRCSSPRRWSIGHHRRLG
jgi:multicomponent K+:H+ antiporter subunit A